MKRPDGVKSDQMANLHYHIHQLSGSESLCSVVKTQDGSEKKDSSQDEGYKPEGHALSDAQIDILCDCQFVRKRGAGEVFDAAMGTNGQPHDPDDKLRTTVSHFNYAAKLRGSK